MRGAASVLGAVGFVAAVLEGSELAFAVVFVGSPGASVLPLEPAGRHETSAAARSVERTSDAARVGMAAVYRSVDLAGGCAIMAL